MFSFLLWHLLKKIGLDKFSFQKKSLIQKKQKKKKQVLTQALSYTMQTQHTAKLLLGSAARTAEARSYKKQ